jgi:hypothetical protein
MPPRPGGTAEWNMDCVIKYTDYVLSRSVTLYRSCSTVLGTSSVMIDEPPPLHVCTIQKCFIKILRVRNSFEV